MTGDNFTRAWEGLLSRYENKYVLISSHLASLFAIKDMKAETPAEVKRILGDSKEALGALEALGCPVQHAEFILVYLITNKLDQETLKRWEDTLGARTDPPSLEELEAFLTRRICALEAIEHKCHRTPASKAAPTKTTGARPHAAVTQEQKCALCAAGHYIASCPQYLAKSRDQRRDVVTSNNLHNTTTQPHNAKACRSTRRCRTCSKPHHTTLHAPEANREQSPTIATPPPLSKPAELPVSSHVARPKPVSRGRVLLATALVDVVSQQGQRRTLRALIDSGSEVSFISESAAQSLRASRRAAAIPIVGIGAQRTGVTNGLIEITLISRINAAASFAIEALVLSKLTSRLPASRIENTQWPHIQGLRLADLGFANPGKIDLLLGAAVCQLIHEEGVRRGPSGTPFALCTALGWILSGTIPGTGTANSDPNSVDCSSMQCSLDHELLEILERFWTQEDVVPRSATTLTPEESECDNHFAATHSHDAHGRFVVRLPLKRDPPGLGNSRGYALRALTRLENRFQSNLPLQSAYTAFLTEYEALDHMRPVNVHDDRNGREFYLPHHDVIRENDGASKIRVVFNGSQRSALGVSLNEVLHIDPKLQTDLPDILLRWRRHRYAFATDIEKMYRQIRVHSDDWPLQKILWRPEPAGEISEYHLCTVTYGLACAPYLALRCLRQLAAESASSRPLASESILSDTYVDDVLSGASTMPEVKERIKQLREALTASGFQLKKWTANSPGILSDVPSNDHATTTTVSIRDKAVFQTLGVKWERRLDFHFLGPVAARSQ